jgi:hypothetical protein
MGLAFTQETLNQIKSKKITKDINNINKIINKQKLSDIYNNIYSDIYKKKHYKYEKESLININSNNENMIIENNNIIKNNMNKIDNKEKEKNDEEINNILFLKHKSIDLSYNYIYKDLLLDNNTNNNIINNQEIYSEKDNESINSDYKDISQEFLIFNNKDKYDKKLLKFNKIRDSYYNKLIIKNQWNPLNKSKIFNNIFFFDWDDTLLCTSYLVPAGAFNDLEINKKDKDVISNLDNLVSKLLLKSINIGFVFIVTNGAPGWVELSSVKFYPKTSKILTKIKIISARGLCEKKFPGDMRQWKTKAFKYAINSIKINKNIPTNIICFGDSIIEIEASYNIKECFPNAYLKTIKFKENPTHTELEKELKIISGQIDSILTNIKNLSIKVTRKKND